MTDMQVKGTPRTLYPGDPLCSPAPAVLTEALIQLLRTLHRHSTWTTVINKHILERLRHTGRLADLIAAEAGSDIGRPDDATSPCGDGEKEEMDTADNLGDTCGLLSTSACPCCQPRSY